MLRMVLIKKQDFRGTSKAPKALLAGWRSEWIQERGNNDLIRDVECLEVEVVIGFRGGLRGEEECLTYLEGVLKVWEQKRQRIYN